MLNQIYGDFFSYFLTYLPTLLAMSLDIVLLVFAIKIKRSSYKYGITLMISSILLITSNVIYISIQYPYLGLRLYIESAFPMLLVNLILTLWSFVFLSLNTTSAILLIVSLSLIYKTHIRDIKEI